MFWFKLSKKLRIDWYLSIIPLVEFISDYLSTIVDGKRVSLAIKISS